MRINIKHIISLITGWLIAINISAQVTAPTNSTGSTDANKNWLTTKVFDASGNVIKEAKVFFDNNGTQTQMQSRVKYRKDASTVYTHVFAENIIRDILGRAALKTLPAPIDNSEFIYKPDFVQNGSATPYDYKNFDRFYTGAVETNKTNNPDPLGNQTIKGTLGWYYSNNNTWEPYVPTTNYPYVSQSFSRDGSGEANKSAYLGEVFKMGSGHEGTSITLPVGNELNHYMLVRNKYFPAAEVGAVPSAMTQNAMQAVFQDDNGKEGIIIGDRNAKALMVARPGSDLAVSNTVTLSTTGYIANIDGDHDYLFISETALIEVYVGGVLTYSGVRGGFNLSSLGTTTAEVRSQTPFGLQRCTWVTGGPTGPHENCTELMSATGSSLQNYYFKIYANATPVSITGNYTLYNMANQTTTSLVGGNSLNKGYYKIVANSGVVTLTYANSYTDISYTFYNQVGQVVATIAPAGVKKLLGTGIDNYATKASVPFITIYEYDLQGRLIKSNSADQGITELVYRKDGLLRFSQNAKQRLTGRYSYSNYDDLGRAIETGEYQPDGSGIVFNSDMSVSSPMKNILENTTSTGGLTTGTKTDVVSIAYDAADNSHGVSGYTQDVFNLHGKISVSRKYSSIVNNTINPANLVSASWFAYNEEGTAVWAIQYVAGLGYKTIDFTLDNLGRLTKKIFQKNVPAETFVHYYEYDPQTQNLWKVYTHTSDDPVNKMLQATYIYYLHGPLKRIELKTNLQGIDYTYTLHGALKAVNNSDKTKDPGGDGANGFQADAYGMVLDYYAGDYVNTRAGVQPIKGVTSGIGTDNFTGLVKAMTWFSKKPTGSPMTDAPTAYVFQYDEKYQFVEGAWYNANLTSTPSVFTLTGNNKESVKHPTNGTTGYDPNGNILFLQRTGTTGSLTDRLTYTYINNSDKLQSVSNDASGTPVTHASYTYDELGQLTFENTGDPAKKKYIKYDFKGNVVLVARDAAFTQKVVEYVYDEMGIRVIKKSFNSSYQLISQTFYTGEAVYTQPVTNGGTTFGTITPQEYEIDGDDDRLGVYYRQSNIYAYELVDHLGGVRAVIAQNAGTLEVRMYNDYYPFGMVLQQGGTNDYRYQYQGEYAERDPETDWSAFELRMYDSRIARWLSIDPSSEYWSPYTAMGNDPANNLDPDGGCNNPRCQAQAFAATVNDGKVYRNPSGGYMVWYEVNGGIGLKKFESVMNSYNYEDMAIWVDAQLVKGITLDQMDTWLKIQGANNATWYKFQNASSKSAISIRTAKAEYWKIQGIIAEEIGWSLIPWGRIAKWGLKGAKWTYKAVRYSGRTFDEAKKAIWLKNAKPTYVALGNPAGGKPFRIWAEVHHRFVPQRWGLPNWITNASWNLKRTNSIQHAIMDPYRYQFMPQWVKGLIDTKSPLLDMYLK